MRFLFPATVVLEGIKCDYKVYEFKLHPGKYKAELSSSASSHHLVKEIIFWKEKTNWTTAARSKTAKHLAQILGGDIDHFKN